jgi:hypothetical protein
MSVRRRRRSRHRRRIRELSLTAPLELGTAMLTFLDSAEVVEHNNTR